MPTGEALHEEAEVGCIVTWVDDQVDVIRHEAVRVDLHAELLAKLVERCEVR